jgi:hypothetical protein
MEHSKLLSEEFIDDEGRNFTVKRTFDASPTIDAVAKLRTAGMENFGESKHIGRVPGWLIAQWLKEAGVRWDDIPARDDVIRKKMMSGEFSALRNWQGKY